MNRKISYLLSISLSLALATACVTDDLSDFEPVKKQKINFDVMVTRDGKVVTQSWTGAVTKADTGVSSSDTPVSLSPDLPFGLIAINPDTRELMVDNATVYADNNGSFSGMFDQYSWGNANRVDFSAYYPHVTSIGYGSNNTSYSIPYSTKETDAGPLVSQTVQRAINELNIVPIMFQHITNDIGYKICDATPMEELQGLIHLRKLTATNVASAGIYENDLMNNSGRWHSHAYYRKIVVFEGDAKVGVGSENEKFVGFDTLEDSMRKSHRYYSIPDDIEIGKQCVEVVYDVEGFTHNGFNYPPLKNQVAKYMLYGLLPNNEFVYGKQYTFHIGLDLSSVYHEITFAPAVGDWETKIYENNDDF